MRFSKPMTLLGLCLVSGAPFAADAADAADDAMGSTLVTVNGQPLTQMHFAVYRSQFGADAGDEPQAQMRLLNELINTTMVAQAAEQADLDQNVQVQAAVQVARARILAQAAIQTHLHENPVTEDEIRAAYDSRYSESDAKEYKARHILLQDEAAASEVIAALDDGADFAELAKERSIGPSGPSGGDLGWFEPSQMVGPFAEATAALDKGSFSKAPVQTQFGYHVILLEDIRDRQPPDYADVRVALQDQLRQQKAAEYLRGIRAATQVEFAQAPEAPQASDDSSGK